MKDHKITEVTEKCGLCKSGNAKCSCGWEGCLYNPSSDQSRLHLDEYRPIDREAYVNVGGF